MRRRMEMKCGEELISDQLKMIYLEERERVSKAVAAAAHRTAGTAQLSTPYPVQQCVFTIGPSRGVGRAGGDTLVPRKYDKRIDPLEERMHELSRIYGRGRSGETGKIKNKYEYSFYNYNQN